MEGCSRTWMVRTKVLFIDGEGTLYERLSLGFLVQILSRAMQGR